MARFVNKGQHGLGIIYGDINRRLFGNREEREELKGMRSRFLLRDGLRPTSLCAARGKALQDERVNPLFTSVFPRAAHNDVAVWSAASLRRKRERMLENFENLCGL